MIIILVLTNEIVKVKKVGKRNATKTYYKVYCDVCGTEFEMERYQYKTLKSHDCGQVCSTKISKYIIEKYGREIYRCFKDRYNSMKQRCNDKNAYNYKYYGGRGILIKYKSFGEFYKYEFKNFLIAYEKYKNNASPDRIDVNGHYEIGNIRRIEFKEQAENRRDNKLCIGIDPKGNYYEFFNQSKFANEHGLLHQSIGKCLRGIMKQTSGWHFYYKDV